MSNATPLRILVNDHCGHPFQVQLSRCLAGRHYTVLHTYCASVSTPRGNLNNLHSDSKSLDIVEVRLTEDFDRYALLQRWRQERELGHKLAALVHEFRPDIVISSNTPLGTQAILQKASRRTGAGFVFWMQDALGVGYRNALRQKIPAVGDIFGTSFQLYERALIARSDEVIVITDDFISYIPKTVRRRGSVTVIENWAPLEELPLVEKCNDWSKRNGLQDTTNFLYSGTLGLKHNPDLLYQLAKQTASYPDIRVVVISEGLGAEWLAERKRDEQLDNLVLLPFQPFEQMSKVLSSSDVLIALLEKDAGRFAVPSKVLTYLCAERPLLLAVPRENLSAKIVEQNVAGITVSPDDKNGFVKAGLRLLQDLEAREIYAKNGRRYAESAFDIEFIADKFQQIIHRIRP